MATARRNEPVIGWEKEWPAEEEESVGLGQYPDNAIRNVGLFAHGGAGKTSLAEAILFDAHATTRLGKVDEGNTVTDYDPDEIKRRISVSAALAPIEWRETKINVIDAPGYAD